MCIQDPYNYREQLAVPPNAIRFPAGLHQKLFLANYNLEYHQSQNEHPSESVRYHRVPDVSVVLMHIQKH